MSADTRILNAQEALGIAKDFIVIGNSDGSFTMQESVGDGIHNRYMVVRVGLFDPRSHTMMQYRVFPYPPVSIGTRRDLINNPHDQRGEIESEFVIEPVSFEEYNVSIQQEPEGIAVGEIVDKVKKGLTIFTAFIAADEATKSVFAPHVQNRFSESAQLYDATDSTPQIRQQMIENGEIPEGAAPDVSGYFAYIKRVLDGTPR